MLWRLWCNSWWRRSKKLQKVMIKSFVYIVNICGFVFNWRAIGSRLEDQARLLKTLWFKIFSRGGGKLGSCGFEHVFLQELKDGISGMHNWVYFHDEQKKNRQLMFKQLKGKMDFGNVNVKSIFHFFSPMLTIGFRFRKQRLWNSASHTVIYSNHQTQCSLERHLN